MRMYDLQGMLIALDNIVSVSSVGFNFQLYNQLHTIAALTNAPTPPINVDEHARFAIHIAGREQAVDIIGTREYCTRVRDGLLKAMAMDDTVQAGDNTLQHAIDTRDAQIENLQNTINTRSAQIENLISLLVKTRTYMKHAKYCSPCTPCVCGLDELRKRIEITLK